MYVPSLYRAQYHLPEEDSCGTCDPMLDYCCNRRPVQTYFLVLTLWATAMTSLVYLQVKHKNYSIQKLKKCPSPLDQTDDRNAEMVLNYPLGDSAAYLPTLGLADKQEAYSKKSKYSVVVITISQAIFKKTIEFIQHVKKHVLAEFFDMKLVIYDRNLTRYQRKVVRGHCQCDVKKFPTKLVPNFTQDLKSVWKPLAIQLLLKEYGFVIWMDSILISSGQLRKAIEIAKLRGIAVSYSNSSKQTSIAETVNKETLEKLGEVQCAFNDVHQFNSSLLLIYEDGSGYITRYIMRPWVSCALTKGCMSPAGSSNVCPENTAQCNSDASLILSILLHRLYYNDYKDQGKFPFEIS